MNLAEWLVRTALARPQAAALVNGTQVVASYAQFHDRAAALGALLRDQFGVTPGDRVAVYMPNSTQYLEILYGIWFCGAAAVPINAKLHPREAGYILEDSGSLLVFVKSEPEDFAEQLTDRCRAVSLDELESLWPSAKPMPMPVSRVPGDLAWLFYTSGTTGRPKGVMLSFGNLAAMSYAYFADVDDVLPEDAALYAAPISHGAGIYNFMHVLRGCRHVVPESGGFDADELCMLIPKLGSVSMFAAPTMVKRLLVAARKANWHGEGLRTVVYGGGPMYLSDIESATDWFGGRFVQIYGQGECPMAISALSRATVLDRHHARWRQRLTSVGTAQSCVQIKIVDECGLDVSAGTIGEITVRGTPVMAGYWDNPVATADALQDGWLYTGDMGCMDRDGFLTLHDRSKDLIISGGSNVYPREVEEILLTHSAVAEVSVVGMPSEEWGEAVVAFIVTEEGQLVDSAILDSYCRQTIAAFKCPKRYFYTDGLPKNNYGKVLKTELRAKLAFS